MGAIVTLSGQSKIADAIANQTDLQLLRLVVGDGNGNAVTPSENQTALVSQVWDGQLASVTRHATNTNWIVVEALIPEDAGPFTVREVGIEDADGDLFAVSDYPATEKFVSGQGVATAITVKLILVVSDTANVTVLLEPSDYVVASRRVDTGAGLNGGGDLTTDREHVLDINTLPVSGTIAGEDTVAVRKDDTGLHVQMSRADFVAGLSGGTGALDSGTNIGDGEGNVSAGVSGTALQFRKIKAGAGINVATTGDNVVVSLADMAPALTA